MAEVALNPWPLQHTDEWQGARKRNLKMMGLRNGKRDKGWIPGLISMLDDHQLIDGEYRIWYFPYDLDQRQSAWISAAVCSPASTLLLKEAPFAYTGSQCPYWHCIVLISPRSAVGTSGLLSFDWSRDPWWIRRSRTVLQLVKHFSHCVCTRTAEKHHCSLRSECLRIPEPLTSKLPHTSAYILLW